MPQPHLYCLLYNTNVTKYKYDYYEDAVLRKQMYSNTITLECNHDYSHDYFNEYPVSTVNVTSMESLGAILFLLLCHYLVF